MKIRSIKPVFARHEKLQELEVSHVELRPMLTFSCLWMACDREGRFEWRPKQLKLDILPFVPYDLAGALDLLAEHSFIVRYEVDGKSYGYIPSWRTHQHINVKESASTIPAPSTSGEKQVKARGEVEVEVEVEVEREGKWKAPEGDAEALPPLQLAHKVVIEGRLPPRSPGLLDSVAGAIEFLVGEGKSRQAAVDFLLDWVRSETARGQPPNRFAFDERKWLRKGGSSAMDEYGGHFEGDVYVDKSGRRMPGYTPPPKPKARGAGV